MDEIRREISQTNRELKLIEKYKLKLEKAYMQKKQIEEKIEENKKILEKEKKDVERLQKMSLASILHSIMGDKQKKLRDEKKESYLASLKYDEARSSYKKIKEEIKHLNLKIDKEGILLDKLKKLREKKKEIIFNEDPGKAKKIIELQNRLDFLDTEVIELDEAIKAAKDVILGIREVKTHLNSAKNWGTYDMLGGGMIATMAKHSKIEDAKKAVDNTQYLLRKLNIELSDVGSNISESLEIGQFASFADYFFDGIFFDWQVQTKINEARNRAEDTYRDVNVIMDRLVRQKDDCLDEIDKSKKTINQILS